MQVLERAADGLLNCPVEHVHLHYSREELPARPSFHGKGATYSSQEPYAQSSDPFTEIHFLNNCGVGRQYLPEKSNGTPASVWEPLRFQNPRRINDMLPTCAVPRSGGRRTGPTEAHRTSGGVLTDEERTEKTKELTSFCPLDRPLGEQLPPACKIILASSSDLNPMTVHIRTHACRTVTLHTMVLVSDVKRALHLHLGIGPETCRLFCKGKTLQEDGVLTEEGVEHGDVIILGDTCRHSRYHSYEKAQSRRPIKCPHPEIPPRQGPPKHQLSVSSTNWKAFNQWNSSIGSLVTPHDREWTMNLSRDVLWPEGACRPGVQKNRFDKTWLNSSNSF
jgi:hypothetical protein